jgi:sec-independent protein translocase protein TatC
MPPSETPQEPRPEENPETEGRLTPEEAALDPGQRDGDDPAAWNAPVPAPAAETPPPPPPPAPAAAEEEEDDEEEGMLRMSFLEHLEELRQRIIRCIAGIVIAFALSLTFSQQLWDAVRQPARTALQSLGFSGDLAAITPTEAFGIVWIRLPLLASVFISAPWIIYQVWAFIAPGLYKRERRMAVPFIFSTATLFVLGGAFAYFVAFRFGLTFLLSISKDAGIQPMISVSEYFDLFVNVILGTSLIFELPVLIFFLTLLRIANPSFLLRHSRYAILIIVIVAAIITPTPDVVNLAIFATPMILLYFVGVFASYLLVLSREGRKFPWAQVIMVLVAVLAILAITLWAAVVKFGFHWVWHWPFLVK